MAVLPAPQVGLRADLARLLELSLTTWLVSIVPGLIHELPVLRMSFDRAQSAAIIGQAGIVLAATLAFLAFAVYIIAGTAAKIARLGTRISATWVAGAVLAAIAIPALYRTSQLWLEQFWKPAHPVPPAIEVLIWLVLIAGLWTILRRKPIRKAFDRVTGSASKFALLALAIMLLSWATWSLNYSRLDPPVTWRSPGTSTARPNIILITIDTLSARHTSLLGYTRKTTPNLDRFSAQATVYTDAISSSNFTTPGIAAILTGRHATRNGVHHLSSRLPVRDIAESVPGQLHQAGYQVAGFIGNNWAHPANFGLDRYFDVLPFTEMRSPFAWPYFVPTLDSRLNGMGLWHFLFYPWTVRLGYLPWWNGDSPFRAEEVFSAARSFLLSREDRRPLFLWVHIFPPHGPYLPPEPFKGTFLPTSDMGTFSAQERILFGKYSSEDMTEVSQLGDRYDENIVYVDAQLGQFLDFLQERSFLESSYLFITSDHGESFEKGWRGHDIPALHQALIHVPLVLYSPDSRQSERVETPVQTVDVAATVLDVAGIRNPPKMDGRSLVTANASVRENPGHQLRYAMYVVDTADSDCPDKGLFAVFEGGYKLVWDKTSDRMALYDLDLDSNELIDISSSRPEYVAHLKSQTEQDLLVCDKYRNGR